MDSAGPRAALAALVDRSGASYAALSRLLGRNPAYLQQFVTRGSPRRLAEGDRDDHRAALGVEPQEALGLKAEEGLPHGGAGDAERFGDPAFGEQFPAGVVAVEQAVAQMAVGEVGGGLRLGHAHIVPGAARSCIYACIYPRIHACI